MSNADTLRKLLKEYARLHIDLATGESGFTARGAAKAENELIKQIEKAAKWAKQQ